MRYRLLSAAGEVLDEGEGGVELAGGALVLSPRQGEVLRVAPADIAAIEEPEPYALRLVFAGGEALELARLGVLRTQVLAELADARAGAVAATSLLDGVGRPEVYPGACGGTDAELRLYDDALVVLPLRGDPDKVPYPFIRDVRLDASGYQISVRLTDGAELSLSRLARRTGEFVDLLRERCAAASGRTAAFLGALLPGLGPVKPRAVAGVLRDGLAGARAGLDELDPTVWPALASAVTRPDRAGCLDVLAGLGDLWLGVKQVVSVQRPAQGGQAWRDPAVRPDLGGHGASGGAFGPGLGGVLAAGLVAGGPPRTLGFDGPFQAMGAALAYTMLGTGGAFGGSGFGGSGFGGQHQIRPRADVTRGRLTPAGTDLDGLGAAGEEPTVLAFLLCRTPGGALVYEALNAAGQDTYVYRADGAPAVAALNRALDLVGFRVADVHADTGSAGSPQRAAAGPVRLLREAYAGRVAHADGWADRVRALAS